MMAKSNHFGFRKEVPVTHKMLNINTEKYLMQKKKKIMKKKYSGHTGGLFFFLKPGHVFQVSNLLRKCKVSKEDD